MRSAPHACRAARGLSAALLLGAGLLGAAPADAEDSGAADVQAMADADVSANGGPYDPWERANRRIFAFNDGVDRYFVEPIAIGWDTIVPHPLQLGIRNVFWNLEFPRHFLNDLFQAKPRKAAVDLGRFVINTSFGVGGLFDPARTAFGLEPGGEDFGQTLGVWGMPAGRYLVLPLLGPSNLRDALGLAVQNFALSPERYFIPNYVSYAMSATQLINARALVLETFRAERAAAFDLYAAVRNAYSQYRSNAVRDRSDEPEEEDEDLYYFDEDDE